LNNIDKFIIARWAYAIGEEFIGDYEYKRLEDEITKNNLLPEYTNRTWSDDLCPIDLLNEYNLNEYIVPFIFNYSTESIESLNTPELVKEKFLSLNKRTRLSFKLDGWSLRLNYFNGKLVLANTRNRNGGKSINLSNIISLFCKEIPIMGKVLITGELYIKSIRWENYKILRGNVSQRNAVSTAVANGDIEFLGYKCYNIYYDDLEHDIDKYSKILDLNIGTPKYLYVNNYNELINGINILGKQKDFYDAPSDGLVAENSSMQFAIRIGAWKEEINKSYVTGYNINRGMYNNSLLVSIRPIKLENKTVSEIPVTNIQTIIDNNLRIGYPIAFSEVSAVNSIIDTTKTEEMQYLYNGRYDEYAKEIDELYK
jgi:hypothetical protein